MYQWTNVFPIKMVLSINYGFVYLIDKLNFTIITIKILKIKYIIAFFNVYCTF